MGFLQRPNPACPQGNGRNANWFQWVHDRLSKELRFASSPSIRMRQGPDGITFHATGKIAEAQSVAGLSYYKFVSCNFIGNGFAIQVHSYNVGTQVEGTETSLYMAMLPELWQPLAVTISSGSLTGANVIYETITNGSLAGTDVRYVYDSASQHRTASWTPGKAITAWGGSDPTNSEEQFITPCYNNKPLMGVPANPGLAVTISGVSIPVRLQQICGQEQAWDPYYV